MIARVKSFVTACVGAVAFIATAHAADVPGSWSPSLPGFEAPKSPVTELMFGWYLRGDIGYRWPSIDRATPASGFPAPTDNELSAGFWGGGGAGFKTGSLRIDLTLDYAAPVDYRGTVSSPGDAAAKVQASTALLNVYYDIASWSGLTPYIGAGIGSAYTRVYDYQSAVTPPLSPVPEARRWNLAWSLMAGVSYQLTREFAVDTGYRFLGLGSVETGSDSSGKLTLNNLTAHEFRIGLRWTYSDSSIR